ncbi:MAG: serine protein kinase RIO [Halobacteria archaeon]|nr:serine protein kinase RIO [Halobacteria archaeon]
MEDETVSVSGSDSEFGWEKITVHDEVTAEREREWADEIDRFRERIEDSEDYDTEAEVFDVPTLKAVYKLVEDGYVEAVGAPVSTGKEANVFEADGEEGSVALKIYRVATSNFRDMRDYFEGDPRFDGVKNDKKDTVIAWTKKEFSNLKRAEKAGVRVPSPIAVQRNVLVMEFIGRNEERAPTLREVSFENPETAYEVVVEYMRRLYSAGLVHGDLSEYNILVHEGDIVVIDVGQAVTVHHPNSRDFLERDCRNVARFFSSRGLNVDADAILEDVTEA